MKQERKKKPTSPNTSVSYLSPALTTHLVTHYKRTTSIAIYSPKFSLETTLFNKLSTKDRTE